MRRAVLAFGSTVAGLILLLSFRSHTATPASAGVSAAGTSSKSSAGAAGNGSSGGSGGGSMAGSAAAPSASPSAAGGGTGGTTAGGKVVTGEVVNGPYGPSQVAITLSGGKITKVTVLQQTNVGGESQQIDAMAIPQLNQETLTAQSASIDAVSGASYTSAGYKQSLQSAVDQAGL